MKKMVLSRARICAVVLLVLPTVGTGQDSEDSNAPSSDALEEIVVYADAPLIALRVQMERAIDHYFETFNELNSTDEFDIRCNRERLTGSRIMTRQCRAKFYSDLEAEAARQWRDFGGPPPQQWLASRQVLIQSKTELLNEEMKQLVLEHPELLSALTEADEAQEAYRAERERRCEGRILFCVR